MLYRRLKAPVCPFHSDHFTSALTPPFTMSTLLKCHGCKTDNFQTLPSPHRESVKEESEIVTASSEKKNRRTGSQNARSSSVMQTISRRPNIKVFMERVAMKINIESVAISRSNIILTSQGWQAHEREREKETLWSGLWQAHNTRCVLYRKWLASQTDGPKCTRAMKWKRPTTKNQKKKK